MAKLLAANDCKAQSDKRSQAKAKFSRPPGLIHALRRHGNLPGKIFINFHYSKLYLNPEFFQEEIVINAQTLTKGLQALKTEHESLLKGVDAIKSEKSTLLEKSLEMIDLGLGEAHVMVALASHLQVCHVVPDYFLSTQRLQVCNICFIDFFSRP